jgi:hypothetical protein
MNRGELLTILLIGSDFNGEMDLKRKPGSQASFLSSCRNGPARAGCFKTRSEIVPRYPGYRHNQHRTTDACLRPARDDGPRHFWRYIGRGPLGNDRGSDASTLDR